MQGLVTILVFPDLMVVDGPQWTYVASLLGVIHLLSPSSTLCTQTW